MLEASRGQVTAPAEGGSWRRRKERCLESQAREKWAKRHTKAGNEGGVLCQTGPGSRRFAAAGRARGILPLPPAMHTGRCSRAHLRGAHGRERAGRENDVTAEWLKRGTQLTHRPEGAAAPGMRRQGRGQGRGLFWRLAPRASPRSARSCPSCTSSAGPAAPASSVPLCRARRRGAAAACLPVCGQPCTPRVPRSPTPPPPAA